VDMQSISGTLEQQYSEEAMWHSSLKEQQSVFCFPYHVLAKT